MNRSYLKTFVAAAAMLTISGVATVASAGTPPPFQPFAGGSFGVLEEAVGQDIEFTIQNPSGSGLNVFGLMVGISNQNLTASATGNTGWSSDEFINAIDFAALTAALEPGLGLDAGALDPLFAGFFNPEDGIDTVLSFFTFSPFFFPVEPGNQLGGFFGLDGLPNTDFVLFAFDDQFNTQVLNGQTTVVGTAVSEPGTLALFGIGLIGFGLAVRRRRRA